MKAIDPGHIYELANLDGDGITRLQFVKREGDKYPGNIGHYQGTNIQEVCRALIDRFKYLNNQIPDDRNKTCIIKLRHVIWLLEDRAADRHGRGFDISFEDIENLPVCRNCGHIECQEYCH